MILKTNQILIVILVVIFALFLLIQFKAFIKLLKDFLKAESNPINISIFRIILYSTIIIVSLKQINNIIWLSQIPNELRIPPTGLELIVGFIPINRTIASTIFYSFIFFCSLSLLGLFTRFSTIIVTLLGIYVFYVTNLFGKVYHFHHLLWFSSLLTVSRCSDTVSLDSLIKKRNKPLSQVSNEYELPLRIIWILIGIIYFFSGMWKLWDCGLSWALSDNVRNIMYYKWSRIGGYSPLFNLDKYPFLYKSAGLITLFFELSFIFFIFSKRFRFFPIFFGLFFHSMTYFMQKISFWYLWICYSSFINWRKLFNNLNKNNSTSNYCTESPSRLNIKICLIGMFLILGSTIYGLFGIDSFPFTAYPKFNYIYDIKKISISVVTYDANGNKLNLDLSNLIEKFDSARWDVLLQKIGEKKDKEQSKVLSYGLHKLILMFYPESNIHFIRLYKVTLWTLPEKLKENPIDKELIYEFVK